MLLLLLLLLLEGSMLLLRGCYRYMTDVAVTAASDAAAVAAAASAAAAAAAAAAIVDPGDGCLSSTQLLKSLRGLQIDLLQRGGGGGGGGGARLDHGNGAGGAGNLWYSKQQRWIRWTLGATAQRRRRLDMTTTRLSPLSLRATLREPPGLLTFL